MWVIVPLTPVTVMVASVVVGVPALPVPPPPLLLLLPPPHPASTASEKHISNAAAALQRGRRAW